MAAEEEKSIPSLCHFRNISDPAESGAVNVGVIA